MAIFKKLNIGDVVATSGTRVFKKLTTGEPLPIWNGTDLRGTTWRIPNSGWTAEAGYGEFDVIGKYNYIVDYDFRMFRIGYAVQSAHSTPFIAADNICWDKVFADGSVWCASIDNNLNDEGILLVDTYEFTFTGGTDTTNPRLISWLLKNAELTSHRLVINGTYLLNDTITELPIVYADGENITQQTFVNVSLTYGAKHSGGLYCIEQGDGRTLHTKGALSSYYMYDFRTNSWKKDEYRNFTFNNATATNEIGEDVTQILLWWITTNATKQDSQ